MASRLATLVAVYTVAGTAVIYSNNHLLRPAGRQLPFFVSALGQASSYACSRAVSPPPPPCRGADLRQAAGVGALQALTLASGNAAYMHLSVPLVQVLKCLQPIAALLVMVMVGERCPRPRALACLLVLCAAAARASSGDASATATGLAVMGLSLTAEACRVVGMQLAIKRSEWTPAVAVQYTSLACVGWLLACAAAFEAPELLRPRWAPWDRTDLLALAGALGGAPVLNTAAAALLQLTDSATLKAVALARSAAIVCAAAAAGYPIGDRLPWCALAMGAFGVYAADTAGRPPPEGADGAQREGSEGEAGGAEKQGSPSVSGAVPVMQQWMSESRDWGAA
jgi:hypothetical protein